MELQPWQKIHLKDFDSKLEYMKEYQYLKNTPIVSYHRKRYGKFPSFKKWIIGQRGRGDHIGDLAGDYDENDGELTLKLLKTRGACDEAITALKQAKMEYKIKKAVEKENINPNE